MWTGVRKRRRPCIDLRIWFGEKKKRRNNIGYEHGENFKGSVHFRQKCTIFPELKGFFVFVCVKKAGFASALWKWTIVGRRVLCEWRWAAIDNGKHGDVVKWLQCWVAGLWLAPTDVTQCHMWRSRSKPMRRRCPRDSHCVSCDFSTLMPTTTLSFRPTSHSRSWPRMVQFSSELSAVIAKQRNKSAALCDVGTAFAFMQVYNRRNNGSNAEKRRSVDKIFLPFWTDRQTDGHLSHH